MNVIIPMAGLGVRFEKTYPNQLKPLIDVLGKPMIQRVIENINHIKNIHFIIITLKRIGENQVFKDLLNELNINYTLILIEKVTNGPAETCLLAKTKINNNDPLVIINCDQIIADFNIKHLLSFAELNQADGILGVFHSNSKKNSYIKLGEDLTIQEVKEKIVISNIATNGLHFWAKGKDFISSSEEMILKDDRYSNEFYVAPTYNYMIKNGKKILPYYYNLHFPIGTPEDLEHFKNNIYESIKD